MSEDDILTAQFRHDVAPASLAGRMPVLFVSHGGGPWPWVEGMREIFAVSEREFAKLPALLPAKPRAIVVISGHWEEAQFTLATAAHPPTIYDYSGFPPHTYELLYPAPGALATHVLHLLRAAGIAAREDPSRGFDYGVFVPLHLMYPNAEVPVLMLSMKRGYDPAEHLRLGAALAPLRDEGVLIVGSGLTYHNMGGFGRSESTDPAARFESYLHAAIDAPDPARRASPRGPPGAALRSGGSGRWGPRPARIHRPCLERDHGQLRVRRLSRAAESSGA
jgi:aromatic ring-opening dioxygenase catalytic subunit (LigB family)